MASRGPSNWAPPRSAASDRVRARAARSRCASSGADELVVNYRPRLSAIVSTDRMHAFYRIVDQ